MNQFVDYEVLRPLYEGEIVEFVDEVCGVYFRSILIPLAGTVVPQHAHDHDHATYCGRGKALMFVDGVKAGEVCEGQAIGVQAGKEHAFVSLENNTRLTCVHGLDSASSLKSKGF